MSPDELTAAERSVLDHLDETALVAAGWPMGAVVHDNTLDSYMARLRRKLDALDGVQRSIETVRGVGYAWR